jgi:hypothetical protein
MFNLEKTKKISLKEESVFYCSHFQRKKWTHANSHYGKIKGVDRFWPSKLIFEPAYSNCSLDCGHICFLITSSEG